LIPGFFPGVNGAGPIQNLPVRPLGCAAQRWLSMIFLSYVSHYAAWAYMVIFVLPKSVIRNNVPEPPQEIHFPDPPQVKHFSFPAVNPNPKQ
jgi:hypothetical protein